MAKGPVNRSLLNENILQERTVSAYEQIGFNIQPHPSLGDAYGEAAGWSMI